MPDPKKHLIISLIKSGLRIIAAINLCFSNYFSAGAFFIIAEGLGILEELV